MPVPKLILASQSTVRATLLRNAGLTFDAQPAHVEERQIETSLARRQASATEIALTLSQLKARKISTERPDAYVIGCDQILLCEDKRLSKAVTMTQAAARLKFLSGKYHHLITAVCLMRGGELLWDHADNSSLLMRKLTKEEIQATLIREGEEIFSTIGCYRLEGPSLQLFERIEGSLYSMLGLPLLPLLNAIRAEAPELMLGAEQEAQAE